ncbi:sulfate transporter isoform X3 [Fopius arisanus]|uniref:Sulfate transporter isoform X3 n=1 Tax=Fopius arisanus TaxID=64838 RepID=A0A9R1U992_9HYME|nr:PREDICTED: sulfate transporter-like isoform X3 [Fopius arisanus]
MSLLDDVEKQVDTVVHLRINRPLYDQNSLNQEFSYEKPKTSLIDNISTTLKQQSCHSCATSVLPVIDWLRKYKWRDDILSDIISGITVAIMHIPQGMAYALLGNLPPVVGIYMAFFPVLVYFFFGTSRHVSMGTFAIVCLMTGKAVAAYSTPQDTLTDKVNGNETVPIYTPQQVATAVTFTVGIMQIMMFFLRLGIISTLLSETLVNGFTTGAAIHVLMSQIKDLLGLTLRRRKVDHFEMVYTTIDTVRGLKNPNYAAIIVSAVAIVIMWSNNEYLKPWIKKKCSMPLPIELIAVVTGSLISNYFDLSGRYSIKTVGDIPKGLPKPEIPTFQLLPTVAVDCIAITMVSYTITLSMALIFAQKLQYDIDSNQELFAMVALKGMLLQAKQLPRFWRLSKLDGMVWIVTVLTVVLIGIDIGLLAGLLTSVASILLLSIKPYACLLGHVPNTDLYLDLTRYKSIIELQGIKIFHYCGGLNFANANHFKSQVFSLVGVIPQKVLKIRAKRAKNGLQVYQEQEDLNCVIMDMSALSYVDPSGIKMLHAIADDFSTVDIEIYIAGCSAPVFESFVRCEKFSKGDHSFKIFATIHDAVTYACDKFIVR